MILVKDAHHYPAKLTQVTIQITQENRQISRGNHLEKPIDFSEKIASHIIPLDLSGLCGWVDVDVSVTFECGGRSRTYQNDNHRGSSHRPLRVFVADERLPRFPDLHLGDPHTHSHFTDDQVEFGIPIPPAVVLAKSMGLTYFCVTDHSYDLDDSPDSFLVHDPTLSKWKMFQADVDRVNSLSDDFAVVRGEEVSCCNSENKNVHFLVLGEREFIHGSGDGAERIGQTRSEHTVAEVLKIKSADSPTYAAHAKEPVPFLQRLILSRGIWTNQDLALDGLTGMQIINGRLDEGFREGYRMWRELLLRGKKIYAIAGNDAHGNFNRFRQIGIPFLSVREQPNQIFGKMRTGLFLERQLSEQAVLLALRRGNAVLTDGPVAKLCVKGDDGSSANIGEDVVGQRIQLHIEALSTREFGEIDSIRIFVGKKGDPTERMAYRFDGKQGFWTTKSVAVSQSMASYVRAEVWTSEAGSCDSQQHFCMTNPIWIREQ